MSAVRYCVVVLCDWNSEQKVRKNISNKVLTVDTVQIRFET